MSPALPPYKETTLFRQTCFDEAADTVGSVKSGVLTPQSKQSLSQPRSQSCL